MGISEEDEQPAPAQIDGADPVAAGIRQLELDHRAEGGRRRVCGLAIASCTRGLMAMRRQAGANHRGREAAEKQTPVHGGAVSSARDRYSPRRAPAAARRR